MRITPSRQLLIICSALLPSLGFVPDAFAQQPPADEAHERSLGEPVDFLLEVKPILVRRCYACHGPDPDGRAADLRLDDRADAIRERDGIRVIVPGRADESELLRRILPDHPEDRMPPTGEGLTTEEIDVLRRWIDQGAGYRRHWSFEPVRDPTPPEVRSDWSGLVREPIDRFLLERIEQAGLEPAGDATPSEQLRRLAFDLTGLPPDPEDVVAFERDPSDRNWDGFVERYLASPDFGERWARHWMDLVRYAETCGHEFDYPIADAWRYRDYLIRALNDDVPYDRLLREHLAGDLLDPRIDPETGIDQSVLGTAFYHFHQAVHGPVDVRQDQLERIDNQIDVMTKAFTGMTVSCARCHDHKFDPISQADYYGFVGYLQGSRRTRTYLDPQGRLESARAEIESIREAAALDLALAAERADSDPLAPRFDAVRSAVVPAGTPGSVPTERMLFDFDRPDFAPWVALGDAFARGPQTRDQVRSAFRETFRGEHMLNTCDDRPGGGGDEGTGTLTSPIFPIEDPVIVVTLSGGRHPDGTCVELLVDGKVVRTATGHSDVVLREVEWDVTDLLGRPARIRIADRETGPWGHVVVEDVRTRAIPGFDGSLREPLEVIASTIETDTDGAAAWIGALNDPVLATPGHPLRPWALVSTPEQVDAPEPDRILDHGEGRAVWFDEGQAWPRSTDRVLDSGTIDGRLRGTLRSRTFTLEHDHLMVRARGRGTVRLIVDGFMMDQFNPLLFEGLIQSVNDRDWRILTMRTAAYVGRTAWIELIDDTDDALEVDWIVLDDDHAARPASSPTFTPSWSDVDVLGWLEHHGLRGRVPEGVDGLLDSRSRLQETIRARVPELGIPARALAMHDGEASIQPVLVRGDHEIPGAPAPRGFIAEISGDLVVEAPGSGRLELAEAILDPGNPLTARVAVNRLWHHLTGRGIVGTTDDFGALGSMPTHPDLLDHLATDLGTDWSLKRMIGRIVRSSAYRRSSTPPIASVAVVDPVNDLLSHARIRRLQAETIRDAILSVSGRLEPVRYGPPVPIHLTDFMAGRGRPGRSGPLDGDGRRSIYLEVRRNFPNPFLSVFDLPVPTTTTGNRNVSNVPAQSLTLMNDPFVHAMSRVWGDRAAREDDLERLWRTAFSRAGTPEELRSARAFIEESETVEDGWSELCHVLINAKEFTHLN